MGLESEVGLTTLLLGNAELSDVVQPWKDTSLSVLCAGPIPPNPSELLGSEPMQDLFSKLTQEYEFILVDSPPVVPVIDAVLIDKLTGGTLLVVNAGRTRKRDLASALKSLATVEAKLAGFTLNMVPSSESDVRRYGYYRYEEPQPEKESRRRRRGSHT
jgi:capsular exopolysaccharide synthesis family protein